MNFQGMKKGTNILFLQFVIRKSQVNDDPWIEASVRSFDCLFIEPDHSGQPFIIDQ